MKEQISTAYWHEKLKQLGIIVIIPSYNNGKTLAEVIASVRLYAPEILVVNDGSTDETPEILNQEANLHIITHPVNQGKGVALKHGLSFAKKQGFRYAITIDSDGQHFASDIPVLIEAIEKEPDTLLVGSRNLTSDNMPGKNTFANKFSNFWFTLETGIKLQDTQSGYRLYPIHLNTNERQKRRSQNTRQSVQLLAGGILDPCSIIYIHSRMDLGLPVASA